MEGKNCPDRNLEGSDRGPTDGGHRRLVTLITHSASGGLGWLTAVKNSYVKAVISYEPVRFLFPEGELPPAQPGALFPQVPVPLADFMKLTKIPIQIVYGDNLDKSPTWTGIVPYAKAFVETVNRYGGNASLLQLPDIGVFGNTHFAFSDLNNVRVADLLSEYLNQHELNRQG